MEYHVAIPSYKRPELLTTATLAMLAKYGASSKLVTIFVADDEEYREYRKVVPSRYEIVKAVPGLLKARQWYHSYYDAGTPLLNMDDDIRDLSQKSGDALEVYTGSIDELAETGFGMAEKYFARLWGINPVNNGFFLKDEVTVGLRYICGIFHGNYAGDPALTGPDRPTDNSSGEDYETTIRSFLMNGSVVRLEWLTPITKYFAPGGMDSELSDRQMDHAVALRDICARYPDWAKVSIKAKGETNIRLKAKTYAREPRI